jgi:ketosteroid isomerase-like protein
MSEANIQIAKQAYEDFGRGDIAAILNVLDENIVWITPGNLPDSGTRQGRAEVAKFFQSVAGLWDFQAFEPRDYISSGDQVAVVGSSTVTARSTGRQATAAWVMVWKFGNGKVTNFQEYTDTAALENILAARSTATA